MPRRVLGRGRRHDRPAVEVPAVQTPVRTRTQAHYAALDDDSEALAELLAGGADAGAVDEHGATPLHCAVHVGALGALTVLLAQGTPPDPADDNGNTPLIMAVTASNGDLSLVQALLDAGADPHRLNSFERSPALMADLLGHTEQVALFARYPVPRSADRRRAARDL